MSHEVDTKSLSPDMKAYLSKATLWRRMQDSKAKVEQQVLSTKPGKNEYIWLEATNEDGSKDRWGFTYRATADGLVFEPDDLHAYFHYPDADSIDAVHGGIIAFYDQDKALATSVKSSDLSSYEYLARRDLGYSQRAIDMITVNHHYIPRKIKLETEQSKSDVPVVKNQAVIEPASSIKTEPDAEKSEEIKNPSTIESKPAAKIIEDVKKPSALESLLAKTQEEIAKTSAIEEQKASDVASKYKLSDDVDRSDEASEAYATTFQLESQSEEDLNYMREQLADDAELFESNQARLEELSNLVLDDDPDMLQEKENIKAREEIRKKIEATERESEDKLDETKRAAASKYKFEPGSGEESDTAESASEQAETPEQDLSADAAVAADETAAAEAAITTPDATDIAQYAASVSKEPMINHIFKNSFYNDRPTTKWAYAMDFIPTNEFLSSHTASEIVEMCKLLTRATIKTEIPARSSTSVTSRYKGISIELPARTTASGDLRITFAENKYSDIARTLHFLMQSSHNRNYPIDLSSMTLAMPSDDEASDEDTDIEISMPFRWSNGYHAHQFNIAIYLYRSHEAHIFNPFAEGKTPEYVYLFHQCDLYGVDKVDFNYDNDGMIDIVGTFMYQHFEEMRFLEYCHKRYITYDEWQDKEAEKQKALLAEIEAKKAEEAAAKEPVIRQSDGVLHSNEYLKAKEEAAAAYVDSQALSQRASMASQQAGMSSYGRRR